MLNTFIKEASEEAVISIFLKAATYEKAKGGLADNIPDHKFDEEELEKGTRIETEHTDDMHFAKEIAKDHLRENPKYYKALSLIEKIAPHIDNVKKDILNLLPKTAAIKDRDIELWKAWKNNPSQQNLAELMRAVDPIVKSQTNRWLQSGIDKGILRSESMEIVFQALHTFNPNMGAQLSTHLINSLQQLSRFVTNNQNLIRTPEHHIQGYRKYLSTKNLMEQEMGREPTENEIKSRLGSSKKLGDFKPMIENYYGTSGAESGDTFSPIMEELGADAITASMLHEQLTPKQRIIFDRLHRGAKKKGQVKDLARELGISSAAVSKTSRIINTKFRALSNRINNLTDF